MNVNCWRGCLILAENKEEIMVKIPKNLLSEVDGLMKYENSSDLSDFICEATQIYLNHKKKNTSSVFMKRCNVDMKKWQELI